MIYYHLIKQLNMTAFKEDLRWGSDYGSSECWGEGVGPGRSGSAGGRKAGGKANQEV